MTTKVRKLTHMFLAIRNILRKKELKHTYDAMCGSLLDYASLGWGGCAKTVLDQVEKAQKSLLRVILKKPFRYSSDALFEELQVLDVRQLYMRKLIFNTHKQRHLYPNIEHTHDTRHSRRNPIVPFTTKTSLAQRHFSFLGPKLYNIIPDVWKKESTGVLRKLSTTWLHQLGRNESELLLFKNRF